MNELQQIISALEQKRLHKALFLMNAWTAELHNGFFYDRIENLRTNYNYLLQYFAQNIEDRQRTAIYAKLTAECYELACDLYEAKCEQNDLRYEFTQIRLYRLKEKPDCEALVQILTNYTEGLTSRESYEQTLNELFSILWLETEYRPEILKLYRYITSTPSLGENEKSIAISALTLNLWRHFSKDKLNLLFDTCLQTEGSILQRALVGLIFLLTKYDRYLPHFPAITKKIALLTDRPEINALAEKILTQIIRTSETEKITQAMQTEIIPELLKVTPQLRDKLNSDSFLRIDNEPNPEWSDFLENSGIGKKMQEISEMQMEGSDVYMSTFATLKQSPFFHDICHWFLPFDPKWSDIAQLFENGQKNIISTFINNNIICDSDKYSFCFSIMQMPVEQQNAMKNSLTSEMEQMVEQMDDDATNRKQQKLISNQYIQNLYRFFKLNRHHHDWEDMFNYSLQIHQTGFFPILFSDRQTQLRIANFYFIKKAYQQAAEMFEMLEKEIPTAELFQKKGYSFQQLGMVKQATQAYERADLIAPDNIWTIKHLALCARLQGELEKAISYYQQVDKLSASDKRNQLNLGLCLLEMQKYTEAMQLYYKLDIEYSDDPQVERAIAWCSFISGNYQQSQLYWERVLAKKPNADDYLNAAHNKWCLKQRQTAIQLYRKSCETCKTPDDFWEKLHKDKPYLLQQGIADDDFALMADSI